MLKTQEFLKTHPLQEITDLYAISVKHHGRYNNLVHLKYSQLDSPMGEEIVQECRGLILDEADDWKVVAFPYKKFFNYGEGNAAQINWSTAKVYEKVDGSLMTLYWYDNQWHVSSSGVPDASGMVNDINMTFADLFWKVWKELGYQYPVHSDTSRRCYMFELCTPYNRVIVPHKQNRIVLHGVRHIDDYPCLPDGHAWDVNSFREVEPEASAEYYKWECVKSFPLQNWDQLLEVAKTLDPMQQEGYVVCDASFNRVKVKTPQYVALAHMRDGMSVHRMLEIVRRNESLEFLAYFPEWTQVHGRVSTAYMNLILDVKETFERIFKPGMSRKDFALQATQYKFSGLLFGMLDDKDLRTLLLDMPIQRLENLIGLKEIKLLAEE